MAYVDNVLLENEEVRYRAFVSKWSLLPLILLGALFLALFGLGLIFRVWVWIGLIVFGLGLIFWVRAWIRYATTELAITNKRVIAKTGFIQRRTIEMFLEKVESVQVDQSVLGRVFNFGTVMISGTGTHSAPFENIRYPLFFRRSFMAAAEDRRIEVTGFARQG